MSMIITAGPVELEALLREPKNPLRGTAIVCHPHPVYGGTMDNRIVYRAAKAAAENGFAALRFNFRGVGGSTGQYDQGIGEKADVTAVIDWIEDEFPGMHPVLIGYSFGAWVGLQVGCADTRIPAMIGLAPPLDLYDLGFLTECMKPALYVAGTKDEFCSQENLDRWARKLPAASSVRRIADTGHFFDGKVEVVEHLIGDFLNTLQPE
jgi:alpha/beta superfamily hydrolase